MTEQKNKEFYKDILSQNEDLFALLRSISGESSELKSVAINTLIQLNDHLFTKIAGELNYKEFGNCDFEDAKQTVILAFIQALDIAIKNGEKSWIESRIPGITRNIAKKELHLQYRQGGITESYETHKAKRRNGQAPSVCCGCFEETEHASDLSMQNDVVDELLKNEVEEIVMRHYNSDMISDFDKEIIKKHVVENVSFYQMAEEYGINYKKLQRQYHSAMSTLAEAVFSETGKEIVYDYSF